ncbi:hypothetical protein J6W91_01885 [Candidatus Saccharibacteria bacterium]|nr:hypothetical protein [Candidatus Saccharibacteria bacterium]
MKKVFSSIAIAVMAAISVFGFASNTYADDIPVTFRVRNHAAEITITSSSDKSEFTVDEKLPDVIMKYKNAIRATIKLIGPDGTELKDENYTLDLENRQRTKIIDLPDIDLEVGEYKVLSSGFNVDGDETVGNELIFTVKQIVPEVPDTGFITSFADFIKNDLLLVIIIASTALVFAIAFVIKKGAKNEN